MRRRSDGWIFSQFWGPTHTPSPRVPAPPSLPRLITSYMNSSLKLIAYKRVATSCFEALSNYIFSNWNCSLNTKYWWLMIKIQIGEQTWFDRSPPYFSSLQFIILTSINAFEMLQHIFKRKYSTPSSSSLAHIITKPDSSNKSPSESGRFTAKCNRIPLLLPAHYHVSPRYTCIHDEQNGGEWCRLQRGPIITVRRQYYLTVYILVVDVVMIFSSFTPIIRITKNE